MKVTGAWSVCRWSVAAPQHNVPVPESTRPGPMLAMLSHMSCWSLYGNKRCQQYTLHSMPNKRASCLYLFFAHRRPWGVGLSMLHTLSSANEAASTFHSCVRLSPCFALNRVTKNPWTYSRCNGVPSRGTQVVAGRSTSTLSALSDRASGWNVTDWKSTELPSSSDKRLCDFLCTTKRTRFVPVTEADASLRDAPGTIRQTCRVAPECQATVRHSRVSAGCMYVQCSVQMDVHVTSSRTPRQCVDMGGSSCLHVLMDWRHMGGTGRHLH